MSISNGLVAQLAAALAGDSADPGDIRDRAKFLQAKLDGSASATPHALQLAVLVAAAANSGSNEDPSDVWNRAQSLATSFVPTVGTNGATRADLAAAVPASTVAAVNTTNGAVAVYVSGGTVTVIAVNGITTGLMSGTFIVGPGDSIAITYSAVPTWHWIAYL